MRKTITLLAILAFGVSANAAIVAQYSFEGNINDTAAGGSVSDTLTYKQGTSVSVVPTYTAGPIGLGGQAAVFDGNWFTATNSVDLSLVGNTWTIETFVKVTEMKTWNRLILKWDTSLDYHFALEAGKLDLHDSSAVNVVNSVNTVPATDFTVGWHHIAITSSAAGAKAWIDGTSVWTGAALSLASSADGLGLGDNTPGNVSARLFGSMDEVRIHNSVVDQTYINGRAALLVPEPSAALLGGLGMLVLLRRRRCA